MAALEVLLAVERYETPDQDDIPLELTYCTGRWMRVLYTTGCCSATKRRDSWTPVARERAYTATLVLARLLPMDLVRRIVGAAWGRWLAG